jgi:hypothetical protein
LNVSAYLSHQLHCLAPLMHQSASAVCNTWVQDRFLGQHGAIFYYWALVVCFLLSPKWSYKFSEMLESAHSQSAPVASVAAGAVRALSCIVPENIAGCLLQRWSARCSSTFSAFSIERVSLSLQTQAVCAAVKCTPVLLPCTMLMCRCAVFVCIAPHSYLGVLQLQRTRCPPTGNSSSRTVTS